MYSLWYCYVNVKVAFVKGMLVTRHLPSLKACCYTLQEPGRPSWFGASWSLFSWRHLGSTVFSFGMRTFVLVRNVKWKGLMQKSKNNVSRSSALEFFVNYDRARTKEKLNNILCSCSLKQSADQYLRAFVFSLLGGEGSRVTEAVMSLHLCGALGPAHPMT